MNAQNFRGLTLSDLDKQTPTSVWAYNMTGSPGVIGASDKRGRINLSVNDGMGNTIPLQVPDTWVPVDLTTQATKASLVANPQFRRLVSSGALKLVTEEDALKALAAPDAAKEAKRVYSLNSEVQVNVPQELKDRAGVEGNRLATVVISVVQRDDLDEDAALSALRSNEMSLSRSDYEYLASNCKHAKVKEWAIAQIA